MDGIRRKDRMGRNGSHPGSQPFDPSFERRKRKASQLAFGKVEIMDGGHDHDHDHGSSGGNEMKDGHLVHGSWLGHALPGTFFLVWGIWWMLSVSLAYHRSITARQKFQSQTWYPLTCKYGCRSVEKLEAWLKAILPMVGMFAEVYFHPGDLYYRSLFGDDGNIASSNVNNWQHFTMYLFFSMSGWLDIFGEKANMPESFNQSYLALSFWMEATLFWFHLKMQFGLMNTIHFLLVLCVLGSAIACTWESIYPESINAAALRAISTVFQGTWFFQTANVLYGTNKWSLDWMANDMILPVIWCWHLAFCILLMVVFLVFTRLKSVQNFFDSDGKPNRLVAKHPITNMELQGLMSGR